jgi:hypothetical protein
MSSTDTAAALDRIANALFQQDKTNRRAVAVQERQATVAEKLLEMQQTNLNVSKALEAELLLRASANHGESN